MYNGRIDCEDGIFYKLSTSGSPMLYLRSERESVKKLMKKYNPSILCYENTKTDLFKIFLNAINYYRAMYKNDSMKAEEKFVEECGLLCWLANDSLYFKTEEDKTKFIMRFS